LIFDHVSIIKQDLFEIRLEFSFKVFSEFGETMVSFSVSSAPKDADVERVHMLDQTVINSLL